MPTKKYKPTTPGRRGMASLSYEEITTDKLEKSPLQPLRGRGGRNNNGCITTRYQGGGHERAHRVIGFKRDKDGVPARVVTIEYDPSRSANIALLNYADGERRCIVAPKGLTVDMGIIFGEGANIKVGNVVELKDISEGVFIHNIESKPGKDGQLACFAGVSTQVLGAEEEYAAVRLASGEVRRILSDCRATIGQVGNEDHSPVDYGRAGCMGWKGVRPTVHGSVINPNDHHHGGGEGRTPVGRRSPMTSWGKKAMGVKTHKAKKASTKLIVRRRNGK